MTYYSIVWSEYNDCPVTQPLPQAQIDQSCKQNKITQFFRVKVVFRFEPNCLQNLLCQGLNYRHSLDNLDHHSTRQSAANFFKGLKKKIKKCKTNYLTFHW